MIYRAGEEGGVAVRLGLFKKPHIFSANTDVTLLLEIEPPSTAYFNKQIKTCTSANPQRLIIIICFIFNIIILLLFAIIRGGTQNM